MINLVSDTIDNKDIDNLVSWLKTYPHLTKGKVTEQYEKKWSEMLGMEYSVFVNSGSSANLLAMYSLLVTKKIYSGDKVIVPALSWATDMAPIVQFGLTPVLCDCNLNDLSIDLGCFEKLCILEKPKAVMFVSVLGLVPDMDKLIKICNQYNVVLLEDTCESLGSATKQRRQLGTFGEMSMFSTYFGHHISTIEGGMVCTNDRETYNILKSLRSHGWDRDLDKDISQNLRKKHNIDEFSALYTFYYPGFNLRSTDLQAFIGLGQLDKLESIKNARSLNFKYYIDNLNVDWKPTHSNGLTSNFAYPIIHKNKKHIVKELQKNNIAVRPLICGSMNLQPAYKDKKYNLPNAEKINQEGFYIPNHPGLGINDLYLICKTINNNI